MTIQRRTLLTSAPLWLAAGCATPLEGALATADGWAALDGDTRGGADARPEHRVDIRDRAALDAALALGDTPKQLRIHGRLDLSGGRGEAAFRDPAFDLDAYCTAFDPATWGRRAPAGPLEEARKRSSARQAAAVTVRLPPRTTLIGATPGAGFINGMVLLDSTADVVIQRLHFHGVRDHFPEWDPLDGPQGAWNSEYDTVSLRRSHHVWVHRCSFDSGANGEARAKPRRLGQPFQQADGLLDITRLSDLVTVSWCRFANQDKTMLIGSSDSQTEDDGRLRVSLHHNLWERCVERTPRVRFGRVHVANNLFVAPDAALFGYSIGIGQSAQVISEANVWETDPRIAAAKLVRGLKGTQFSDSGSRHNGVAVQTAALFAAATPPAFTPPPINGLLPAHAVATAVRAGAGAGAEPAGAATRPR